MIMGMGMQTATHPVSHGKTVGIARTASTAIWSCRLSLSNPV